MRLTTLGTSHGDPTECRFSASTLVQTGGAGYLVDAGALDIERGEVIGLVVQTQCHYFAPLAFPQTVEAGLRVAHLGRSSVRYEVGLFAAHEDLCAARGHFVHVYVDRAGRQPAALPAALRRALQPLVIEAAP